jgi:hypothetical protein
VYTPPPSHTGRRGGIRYPGGVYNRRLLLEPEGGGGGEGGRGYYFHQTRPALSPLPPPPLLLLSQLSVTVKTKRQYTELRPTDRTEPERGLQLTLDIEIVSFLFSSSEDIIEAV